ncbi:MAG: hypothetical protein Q7T11_05150 [Deltaproteobacteria bacterium]|nr:hypothetical protein [Deltaproteobacteria bacterium]
MKKRLIISIGLITALGFTACSNTCRLSKVDKKAVYAVAMTNGSLFFGNISGQDQNNLYLKDIYYFKRMEGAVDPKNPEASRSSLSLVAQVDDFYGPKDEISLNREHVIYYQPITQESKVTELIGQIKVKRASQAPPPAKAP